MFMNEELKVACATLEIKPGKCTVVPKCICKAGKQDLLRLIGEYFHKDAYIVLWQMHSIVWGKYENNAVVWSDEDDVFEDGWQELRVFNEMEELHLYRKGAELTGRYRCDEGEETCEYVDSFSRFWGKNVCASENAGTGFVKLQDSDRKLKMMIPVSDGNAKWYGLLTRNYVTTNDVNGQAGYTDYRFVKIASADLEGA